MEASVAHLDMPHRKALVAEASEESWKTPKKAGVSAPKARDALPDEPEAAFGGPVGVGARPFPHLLWNSVSSVTSQSLKGRWKDAGDLSRLLQAAFPGVETQARARTMARAAQPRGDGSGPIRGSSSDNRRPRLSWPGPGPSPRVDRVASPHRAESHALGKSAAACCQPQGAQRRRVDG